MGLSIKNDEVEQLARKLAVRHGTGITEIIHRALKKQEAEDFGEEPLQDRIQPILERLRNASPHGKPGPALDRSFYDELSGEL